MVNDAATTLGVKDTQRKPVLAMSHPVILTTIASSLGFLSPSRREPWKSADCPIRQSRPLAVPGWHDEASSVIPGEIRTPQQAGAAAGLPRCARQRRNQGGVFM